MRLEGDPESSAVREWFPFDIDDLADPEWADRVAHLEDRSVGLGNCAVHDGSHLARGVGAADGGLAVEAVDAAKERAHEGPEQG